MILLVTCDIFSEREGAAKWLVLSEKTSNGC